MKTKFIFIALFILMGQVLATTTENIKNLIIQKYSCKVSVLDGYKMKLGEFSSSTILQFTLSESAFLNKSNLSEATASDCAIIVIENLPLSSSEKYDTIIVIIEKLKQNYEYRYATQDLYGISELSKRCKKAANMFCSKNKAMLRSCYKTEYLDKTNIANFELLIDDLPSKTNFMTFGFSGKQIQGRIFYTFSYLLSNKQRLIITCSTNKNGPFICGLGLTDKY